MKVKEYYNSLGIEVVNIGKINDKDKILDNIVYINNILNKKYKKEGISFFIDPSFEQGIGIIVPGSDNFIGASLRIKSANNVLDKNRKPVLFSDGIKYFYNLRSYDIKNEKEYIYLLEAANLYIKNFG